MSQLPSQFSPLPVKVEHSRLLLAPCNATKSITENRNSCHFIVPSHWSFEILWNPALPIWQGNVMSSSGLFCACASFCWSKASQARWLSQAHFILAKHTTPFPVKDSTKTHPLSIMATRIHTPHNEVHQSVIALPKAVQELLIRHLLEPWAWAARGCTWLWFFQIGCPKSPLVSYAFKLQHQNWRLISSNFQPKLHTSTSTWSSWCVVRCWTLSLICTVPQKQISKKLREGATIGVCQGTVWIHKMEFSYLYSIFIYIYIQIHTNTDTYSHWYYSRTLGNYKFCLDIPLVWWVQAGSMSNPKLSFWAKAARIMRTSCPTSFATGHKTCDNCLVTRNSPYPWRSDGS